MRKIPDYMMPKEGVSVDAAMKKAALLVELFSFRKKIRGQKKLSKDDLAYLDTLLTLAIERLKENG